MSETLTSTAILLADLRAHEAPAFMIRKAEAGAYNDYETTSATPILDLMCDAIATGRLGAIVQWAMEGKYDPTRAEAEAWFEREGRHLFAEGEEYGTHQ